MKAVLTIPIPEFELYQDHTNTANLCRKRMRDLKQIMSLSSKKKKRNKTYNSPVFRNGNETSLSPRECFILTHRHVYLWRIEACGGVFLYFPPPPLVIFHNL